MHNENRTNEIMEKIKADYKKLVETKGEEEAKKIFKDILNNLVK